MRVTPRSPESQKESVLGIATRNIAPVPMMLIITIQQNVQG